MYEALYPVTGTFFPYFHNLTVFQPINLAEVSLQQNVEQFINIHLCQLGVSVKPDFSDLWKKALANPVESCPCGENCQ